MKKLIFLFLLAAIAVGCGKKGSDYKGAEKTSEEFLLLEAKLQATENTVTELRIDTTRLNGELNCLKAKLIANGLSDKCIEEPVAKASPAPRPAPVARKVTTPTPKPTPAPVVTQVSPPAPPAPVAQQEQPVVKSVVRMPEHASVSIFDGLAENDGGFRLCVRVNGREDGYFPDFAIRKGMKIAGAENNNREGHNLVIYTPTEGFTNPEGGITNGGIIYYPAELIERFLKVQYVDVLFSKNWTPIRMKRSGSWYVYETQQ